MKLRNWKRHSFRAWPFEPQNWAAIWLFLLTVFVILGNFLDLFEPQFLHLKEGDVVIFIE
jgi:hypothetical protein